MCGHFILPAMLTRLKEELQGRMWERFAFWGSFQLIFRRATSKPSVICVQRKPEGRLRSSKGFLPLFRGLGFHGKIECLHFLDVVFVKTICWWFLWSYIWVHFYKEDQRLRWLSVVLRYRIGALDESSLSKEFMGRSANRWMNRHDVIKDIFNLYPEIEHYRCPDFIDTLTFSGYLYISLQVLFLYLDFFKFCSPQK